MPTISIITATINVERTLPRLVASLRRQTSKDFEWIVVDGGSTDSSLDLLAECDGINMCWISEADFGVYHAINKGLMLANSEFYLVVGADDCLEPEAIERYILATSAQAVDIVAAPVLVDGAVVRPRTGPAWLRSAPPGIAAHSVGCLIRRSLHQEFGLYSRRFPMAADTLFLLSVVKAGRKVVNVEHVAGTFGTNGLTGSDILGALSESMRVHTLVLGNWPLHVALFVLRVIKNAWRIR